MATSQKFGGNWTEEKLNIFTSYLDAYLIALQNQKFIKIYIDAFAGTGEIETSDGEQCLIGSAKRALAADRKFDGYFFIEEDEKKAGYKLDVNDGAVYSGTCNKAVGYATKKELRRLQNNKDFRGFALEHIAWYKTFPSVPVGIPA